MILHMIDATGRARIAKFVRDHIQRLGTSAEQIAAAPGRPRIATIKRIKAADATISDSMLRALGGKLGLPFDWLLYIGTGDAVRIRESGADPDLIRVTLEYLDGSSPAARTTRRAQ
jgi:hypothetical protein